MLCSQLVSKKSADGRRSQNVSLFTEAKPPLTLLLARADSLRPSRKITSSVVLEPSTSLPDGRHLTTLNGAADHCPTLDDRFQY
jgi:hypothetical protein